MLCLLAACALVANGCAGPQKAAPEMESAAPSADEIQVGVVKTGRGIIRIAMLPDSAPATVRNFISLAEKGFYNGLTFHRVMPGTLIQGGDPNGDGTGGPGYTIKGEFNELSHAPGMVGMARGGDINSAGSQFYICLRALPQLDRQYSLFGFVYEGLDVASSTQKGDRIESVMIERIPRSSVRLELPQK